MIPGMRESLYVRDDDYRLSFLYGNFITLTNMKEEDFEQIIKTHMSPLYISVHATRPEVRCQMMNNRFAGELMSKINRLLEFPSIHKLFAVLVIMMEKCWNKPIVIWKP